MRIAPWMYPAFFRFALVVAGTAAHLAAAAEPTAVLSSEFLYEQAPYPSCHASTIVETREGELIAAWFGGTAEKNPDVGIWVSRREQGKWTPGVEVANGVQADGTRHPTWNPVLFQPKSGPLMLFYKVGPTPQTWWGMLRTSTDGGRTWSAARRLPEGILGPIKNKPVQLADGTILAGSSAEYGKPIGEADRWNLFLSVGIGLVLSLAITIAFSRRVHARGTGAVALFAFGVWILALAPVLWTVLKTWYQRPSDWMVHFERSADGGETWTATPPLNDGRKLGAIQPSILFHDGIGGSKLQAVGRSRQGKVFTLASHDAGKTWTEMSLLKVPNPSAGTDAVTLADGRHLLVANPVAKGRTPLAVFSSRDGKAWQQVLVLENEPGEYSYPAIIQTSDGHVHVTYTWKRKKIKHAEIDPAQLK
jgi:predicted neuraminidase